MLDDDENGVARLTHAFGVNANVQDAVICTDEVGVLLPVGRMISLFSWESRAMSFVSEGERGDLALALSLAPTKKHVALSERGEHAQVSLYHVAPQRRRRRSRARTSRRDYVSAAFSPDSKLLAALSGAPDYTLVLWLWDKGKVLATVKLGQPAARRQPGAQGTTREGGGRRSTEDSAAAPPARRRARAPSAGTLRPRARARHG